MGIVAMETKAGDAKVGIIGAGAWGTALAMVAARAGREVVLWARRSVAAEAMARTRENARLSGVVLPDNVRPTGQLGDVSTCGTLVLAVPAQHVRAAAAALVPHVARGTPVAIAAKGVERETLALMSDVVAAALPAAVPAVLSGPTFAWEVARGLPTAITLACRDEVASRRLVAALGQPTFRPYPTDDVVGTELGGAVKNVLAIACGIVAGRGLGDNARAALVARGLAEMMRLGLALGARTDTLMGLSGLGDLVLTCTSTQSRNLRLGLALGHGRGVQEAASLSEGVVEGVATAEALVALARRHGVELPVSEAVADVLAGRRSIEAAVEGLLGRPFRGEGPAGAALAPHGDAG
jgi:glycerol-3-phosphate dehydrogenase (NAD(P)+)